MRAFLLFLVACWLPMFLSVSQAEAASDYRGPSPAWVKVHKLPEVKQNRISRTTGGIYYLMVDDQVRWTPQVQVSYRRFAYKVIDRLGLEEAARVTVEFDPTHEEVSFHVISVHRDGRILDRTDSARIKTYQREKQLNDGIVDGHLTAHVDIPDLRVGDIVDYNFSIASRPELALNEFANTVRMSWTVPVAFNRYRVSLPANKRLQIRDYGLDLSPVISETDGETTYEWTLHDADPVAAESDVPSWNISGSLQVSTFDSWDAISKGLLQYYNSQSKLPAGFAAKVDAIARDFGSENDRITEALRLVQDSIRYVGIEIGPGALIPRKPETTVSRGYGDCKDKSMLLITALRRMNIEAVPALVNLKNGKDLVDRLPSLGAFDHLIVRVKSEGKVYWLDPTMSHQGGRIPNVAAPNYGFALPVTAHASSLEQIHLADSDQPTVKLTETFAFPLQERETLKLHSRTVYLGTDADNFRYSLANRGAADFERTYFDFYSKLYPGIKSAKPISFKDDRDRNRLIIEEYYDLGWKDLNKNGLANNFPLSASNLNGTLKTPNPEGRLLPVVLNYPLYRQHSVNVLGLKARFQPPGKVTRDNDALRYEFSSRAYEDSLHLSWELETKKNQVLSGAAKEYAEIAAEISSNAYWTYDFLFTPETEPEWVVWLVLVAGVLLFAVLLVWGTIYGVRADREYADKGVYFPVSLRKFVIMSVMTLGLYPVFWMFKFWRWARRFEKVEVWPVARAILAPLYLFSTYNRARQRFGEHAPAWGYGMAGAVIYLLGNIGSIHMDADWRGIVMGVIGIAGFLPVLMIVNKLNEAEPHALRKNSRFNNWNILGIVLGILTWSMIAFGGLTQ